MRRELGSFTVESDVCVRVVHDSTSCIDECLNLAFDECVVLRCVSGGCSLDSALMSQEATYFASLHLSTIIMHGVIV